MRRLAARRRDQGGYVAVLSVMLFVTLFGMCAFSVDVGNWYYTGQKEQRAADAAALAGVPSLPGNQSEAFAHAQAFAKANGFDDGSSTVEVIPSVDGQPTRLRVTVSNTVTNIFGGIFGIGHTTIVRSAVADYAGPVPMGSPCNEFGNDPETSGKQSSNCSEAGQFWANIGSHNALKSYGDAFQDGDCSNGASDDCNGPPSQPNEQYSANGYFYSVTVTKPVSNLTFQAFDPAFVSVGDKCDTNFGSGYTAANYAKNDDNYNPTPANGTWKSAVEQDRYKSGSSGVFCSGDQQYANAANSAPPDTTFTVRKPVAATNVWDPMSYQAIGGSCTQTFRGFTGDLYTALNQWQQKDGVIQYSGRGSGKTPKLASTGSGGYQSEVAGEFRRWSTLCTVPGTIQPGVYMIQVQTNDPGDNANGQGHNRFALRAYGSSSADKDNVSISGYNNMSIYANLPTSQTSFYLARVPSGAKGQVLDIRLFDAGDGSDGKIQVVAPSESQSQWPFTDCTGVGPVSGPLTNCQFDAKNTGPTAQNGKWQIISIQIPEGYTCNDDDTKGCWVKLKYNYSGAQPSDTTSWAANINGDPVRLVE